MLKNKIFNKNKMQKMMMMNKNNKFNLKITPIMYKI